MDKTLKVTIVLTLLIIAFSVFYYLVIFAPNKEARLLVLQNQEKARLEQERIEQERNNPKSDSYIITTDDNGNPLTWSSLTTIASILKETLSTYETSLPQLQETQKSERENVSQIYGILKDADPQSKIELQTLIKYSESYIKAGDNLVSLLSDLVKNYKGYLDSIEQRELTLYLFYSDEIKKLEAQKADTVADYSNKEIIKQNYAKKLLSN